MKDKAHKEEMESKADAIIAESNKIKDKVFSNVMGKIRPA
jgi:hypothetical protein